MVRKKGSALGGTIFGFNDEAIFFWRELWLTPSRTKPHFPPGGEGRKLKNSHAAILIRKSGIST